jgi:nucleotide-binding universal stress UspA family protein
LNPLPPRFQELQIRRVLAPVDFSVSTLPALQYAGTIARKFGASLNLLHVMPFFVGRHLENTADRVWTRAVISASEKELNELAATLWAGNVVTAVSIRDGRPDEVIVAEARNQNADLIVMGMRGRSWLSRWLRRNTVRHVLQAAHCPVIVLGRAGGNRAGAMGF